MTTPEETPDQHEQGCQRIIALLRRAKDGRLSRSALLRKVKVPADQMANWILTLQEREDVELEFAIPNGRGRTAAVYRLARRLYQSATPPRPEKGVARVIELLLQAVEELKQIGLSEKVGNDPA